MSESPISKKKQEELKVRMLQLGIHESDLVESFEIGGGKGGQKVNKSATKVRLNYEKCHINVVCQKSRSRENNRFFARRLLCEKVDELFNGNLSKRAAENRKKIKKQKKKDGSAARVINKMLEF